MTRRWRKTLTVFLQDHIRPGLQRKKNNIASVNCTKANYEWKLLIMWKKMKEAQKRSKRFFISENSHEKLYLFRHAVFHKYFCSGRVSSCYANRCFHPLESRSIPNGATHLVLGTSYDGSGYLGRTRTQLRTWDSIWRALYRNLCEHNMWPSPLGLFEAWQ